MADVRFYTDVHVARAVVSGLRLRGVDVVTVAEAGLLGASDEEHLSFARAKVRAIFTQDSDFLALAARGCPHPGIIYAPQQTPPGAIIRGLMLIHQIMTAEEMIGAIEFI